jgi:hypothetical protein
MVVLAAVQGESPVLDSVKDPRQPAVIPVNRCREGRVVFVVGGVPREPKRGELLDDLRVLRPALEDALGERIAVSNPADPFDQLAPKGVRRLGAEVPPAPGGPPCLPMLELSSGSSVDSSLVIGSATASVMSDATWSRSRRSCEIASACRMSWRPSALLGFSSVAVTRTPRPVLEPLRGALGIGGS